MCSRLTFPFWTPLLKSHCTLHHCDAAIFSIWSSSFLTCLLYQSIEYFWFASFLSIEYEYSAKSFCRRSTCRDMRPPMFSASVHCDCIIRIQTDLSCFESALWIDVLKKFCHCRNVVGPFFAIGFPLSETMPQILFGDLDSISVECLGEIVQTTPLYYRWVDWNGTELTEMESGIFRKYENTCFYK